VTLRVTHLPLRVADIENCKIFCTAPAVEMTTVHPVAKTKTF
jgi:hypothetical protein